MFTTVHGRQRSGDAETAAKKSVATVLTMIRNDPNQCRDQFTWRLWPHTKHSILPTSWADHFTLHSVLISGRGRNLAASSFAL